MEQACNIKVSSSANKHTKPNKPNVLYFKTKTQPSSSEVISKMLFKNPVDGKKYNIYLHILIQTKKSNLFILL